MSEPNIFILSLMELQNEYQQKVFDIMDKSLKNAHSELVRTTEDILSKYEVIAKDSFYESARDIIERPNFTSDQKVQMLEDIVTDFDNAFASHEESIKRIMQIWDKLWYQSKKG